MQNEKIDFWNPAMQLTLYRMASSLITFLFLIIGILHPLTFAMKIGEAVSDFLDGWVARTFGFKTKLGAMLDPVADKMSTIGSDIFICLVSANLLSYLNHPYPKIEVSYLVSLIALNLSLLTLGYLGTKLGYEIIPNLAGKMKMTCECLFINLWLLSYLRPWGYAPDLEWTSWTINLILPWTVWLAAGSFLWHIIDSLRLPRKADVPNGRTLLDEVFVNLFSRLFSGFTPVPPVGIPFFPSTYHRLKTSPRPFDRKRLSMKRLKRKCPRK